MFQDSRRRVKFEKEVESQLVSFNMQGQNKIKAVTLMKINIILKCYLEFI